MKGYIASFCRTVTAAAILTTAVTSTAQTTTNLIYNGNFGTATYGANGTSTFNPSMTWVQSANSGLKSAIKPQVVEPSYSQFSSQSGSAYNWACTSGSGRVIISTSGIATLEKNTRYRLSFHAFKDITGVATANIQEDNSASLLIKSGARGNYAAHDFSLKPYLFGNYKPNFTSSPLAVEFTAPDEDTGVVNIGAASLEFRWPSRGASGAMCLTNVRLEKLASRSADRVVVNTYGYPLLGSKVATLVLNTLTNRNGLKWRIREGSDPLTGSYSVSIPFYAVVTGADDLPIKDASGNHSLQKNPDGSNKVVGGTGTGGQIISSAVSIPDNSFSTVDPDSGDFTYSIDFSSYGKPDTKAPAAIDLKATPSAYTASNGAKYYIYSQSTTTSTYNACRACYIDVMDSAGRIVATSAAFSTQASPYQALKKDSLYTFYHQRSGEGITPYPSISLGYNLLSESFRHNAGHKPDIASCWANGTNNIDLHGNDWGSGTSNCNGYTKDVSGGWYDAADHGKYVVNGGVALWTLQNMIERLQTKGTLNTAFPAGDLKLPTTLNSQGTAIAGLSDLMAEARTEMEWMLKMQVPDGFKMKVPLGYQDKTQIGTPGPNGADGVYQVDLTGAPLASSAQGAVAFGGGQLPRLRTKLKLTEVDVGGLVFHAVHDRTWTAIPLNPSQDTQPRVLMYPTSAATLNFAAVAAQCSRIWKTVDPVFANTCFSAATKAWNTAKKFSDGDGSASPVIAAKSDIYRYEYTNQKGWDATDKSNRNVTILTNGFALNPIFDGGGAYGDLRVGDEFYWAGAELYLATTARGASDVSYHAYGKTQGVLSANDKNGQWSRCEQTVEPVQCYSWVDGFDWQNTSTLGTLSLLTYNKGTLASAEAKANLLSYANTIASKANQQGYKFSKLPFVANNRDRHYEWGSNGGILNRAIILGVAAEVQTNAVIKANYLNTIVNSMGYLLGRNTLEKSFISGYGNNAMNSPHHRWFAKGADVAYPTVPAGYIAGGVNTRDIGALRANAPRFETQDALNLAISEHRIGANDPEAKVGGISDSNQRYFETNVVTKVDSNNVPICINETAYKAAVKDVSAEVNYPTYVPQRCYADHYHSYATNEVAINWQAPLVWVTQFLSETY